MSSPGSGSHIGQWLLGLLAAVAEVSPEQQHEGIPYLIPGHLPGPDLLAKRKKDREVMCWRSAMCASADNSLALAGLLLWQAKLKLYVKRAFQTARRNCPHAQCSTKNMVDTPIAPSLRQEHTPLCIPCAFSTRLGLDQPGRTRAGSGRTESRIMFLHGATTDQH